MDGSDLRAALQVAPGPMSTFSGRTVAGGGGMAFGGQMAAQALFAASALSGGRSPESIHSFFLAPVQPGEVVEHHATQLRKGRAFSTIRIDTKRGDRFCLSSIASFHDGEVAPEHQAPMPTVLAPETYPLENFVPPNTNPRVRECFEIRLVGNSPSATHDSYPRQTYWLRHRENLGDDPALHSAALVWFSDLSMPWTTDLAYDERHGVRLGASLDHTIWFHRPVRADDWLLFAQESIVYAGARALTRGIFYDRDGALVASVAQETLLRRLQPSSHVTTDDAMFGKVA